MVYRPSDLEVDCLIIGDSAAINMANTGGQFRERVESAQNSIALQVECDLNHLITSRWSIAAGLLLRNRQF